MCKVNDIIKARVTNIKEYGAFVRIEDKQVGMIHISEVSDFFVKEIDDFFSVGEEIDVKVLGIESGKYKLSFKQVETNNSAVDPGFGPIRKRLQGWIKDEQENSNN